MLRPFSAVATRALASRRRRRRAPPGVNVFRATTRRSGRSRGRLSRFGVGYTPVNGGLATAPVAASRGGFRRSPIALCNIRHGNARPVLHKTNRRLRVAMGLRCYGVRPVLHKTNRRLPAPSWSTASPATASPIGEERARSRGVCATVADIPPRAVRRGALRSRARPTRRRRRRVARLPRLPSTRRRATRR